MKFLKLIYGSLLWIRVPCLTTLLILVIAEAVSPGHAAALAQYHTQKEISLFLSEIKKDAEQQIVTIHGISKLAALKNSLIQEYHLNEAPLPQKGDPCPALGFTADDIGTVINARALNRAGVYYVVAVEAVLKGYPEIAKWGFANASSMCLECASYISNLAFILNEYKDFKHAAVLLEYAKQLDPADSSIYVNLAFSYQHLYRYTDAINEMMIAVSLHPKLKKYQEKLAGLKKLKKEEQKYYYTKNGSTAKDKAGSKSHTKPQLDEALAILEQKEQAESQKDQEEKQAELHPPLSDDNGERRPIRNRRRNKLNLINSYEPPRFEENDDTACNWFNESAGQLIRIGDEYVNNAGYKAPGGNPIEKFIATGGDFINEIKKNGGIPIYNMNKINELGSLAMANLFYGMAGEMYQECGGYKYSPEMDKLIKDYKDERIKWTKEFFENIDKEEFSKPVCTPKGFCVSKGSQGTYQFTIPSKWMGDYEFKIHPTNIYKHEVKVSKGVDLFKKDIGGIASGSASVSTYHECKFGRGCSGGSDMGMSGSVGKIMPAKAEKSTSLFKCSFENSTGTTDTP